MNAVDDSNWGDGSAEAFITRFNATGTELVYSTLLSGAGEDVANEIALDSTSNCYVTGSVSENIAKDDFPLVRPFEESISGNQDAFVIGGGSLEKGLVNGAR